MTFGTGLGFKPAGIPMVAPSYGPGPYHFRGTRALMLIGPVEAEQARALLPPPLELLDDSIVIWTLMDCPDVTGMGAHNCACPAIPCRYGDVAGQFVPFLLTSTEASLLCFREVHGWAAILGETVIEQVGDRITGRVSRIGATVADIAATIDGDQLIGAIPKTPTFLYKEIPSIDTGSCDVSRLIATTSALENVALRTGSGRIEFPGGKDDPFSTLAPTQVDQLLFGTWDDVFPETARIIHQY